MKLSHPVCYIIRCSSVIPCCILWCPVGVGKRQSKEIYKLLRHSTSWRTFESAAVSVM